MGYGANLKQEIFFVKRAQIIRLESLFFKFATFVLKQQKKAKIG